MTKLTLLNASAGSGKTHRITFEFIKIILPNATLASRILAITFTNKAAREMKERIISELAKLSSGQGQSKMEEELLNDLNYNQKTLEDKSKKALSFILHNYSDISVSTIDSFIQKIIRSFSRDLGLPADYEVLIDDEEMNNYIMDSLIDKVNIDTDLTQVFKQIIERNLENDSVSWDFKKDLLPIIKNLAKEASTDIIDEALNTETKNMIDFMKKIYTKLSATNKNIKTLCNNFDKLVSENNLTAESFFSFRKISIYNELLKIKNNAYNYSPTKSLIKILEEKHLLNSSDPKLEITFNKLFTELLKEINNLQYIYILAKDFPVIAIIGEMSRIRKSYKSQEGILPVSDFYTLIAEVLANEPVPFIFMRAGTRYKNIMIDEFQDTSLMQWINLIPLIHNSLAMGNSNWLVGDPKQSIYRWRNGQMEIMLSLPKIYNGDNTVSEINEASNLFSSAFHSDTLEFNYRSDENIVLFNNSFFSFIDQQILSTRIKTMNDNKIINDNEKEDYSKVYKNIKQNNKNKGGGYIEAQISYDKASDDNSKYGFSQISEIIYKKLEEGFSLQDIAILCRKRSVGVKISNYLLSLEKPIQVISDETLQFQSSYYCRLGMSVFRCLSQPKDKYNNAECLSLLMQNSDKDINNSSSLLIKSKESILLTQEYIYKTWPDLQVQKTQFLSPTELFDSIINALDISEKGRYYIIFLREKISEQENKHGTDYDSIWTWWQEQGKTSSVVCPQESNAINIMTLHKSKGLQFPIVIMPDFDFNDFSKIHNNLHWFVPDNIKDWGIPFTAIHLKKSSSFPDIISLYERESLKTLLDSINLMYVACTRAEQQLFLLSRIAKKDMESIPSNPQPGIMLYHFLENAISKDDNIIVKTSSETRIIYKYGEEKKHRASKEESKNSISIQKFYTAHPFTYKEATSDFDSEELRESAREGQKWHEILAIVNMKSKIDETIKQYVINGLIPKEKEEESIEFLNNIIKKHPSIFPSSANILNEIEIADTNGNIYRPDKIIHLESGNYHIIDFKTGQARNSHKKQISAYADILRSMNLIVEKSSLLYIRPNENTSELIEVE